MKKKEKVELKISIDKKLSLLIDELISNRSAYIEYLIYQDMMKHQEEKTKNILI